jgi:hypothetical protein
VARVEVRALGFVSLAEIRWTGVLGSGWILEEAIDSQVQAVSLRASERVTPEQAKVAN